MEKKIVITVNKDGRVKLSIDEGITTHEAIGLFNLYSATLKEEFVKNCNLINRADATPSPPQSTPDPSDSEATS